MLNAHSTSNSVWLYDFFDFHWGQKLIEQITGREWEKAARTQVLQSILRQVYCLYLFWSARTESLDVVHAWKKKQKTIPYWLQFERLEYFVCPRLLNHLNSMWIFQFQYPILWVSNRVQNFRMQNCAFDNIGIQHNHSVIALPTTCYSLW